jgi:hypothetical protein
MIYSGIHRSWGERPVFKLFGSGVGRVRSSVFEIASENELMLASGLNIATLTPFRRYQQAQKIGTMFLDAAMSAGISHPPEKVSHQAHAMRIVLVSWKRLEGSISFEDVSLRMAIEDALLEYARRYGLQQTYSALALSVRTELDTVDRR